MLLPGAQSEFESLFESVTSRKEQQVTKDLPVVWSGGQRAFEDTSAALYATKDLAIIEWLNTARSFATDRTAVLEWVLKPELHEFQITIADRHGQHRVVSGRFAVKSQFVVKEGK